MNLSLWMHVYMHECVCFFICPCIHTSIYLFIPKTCMYSAWGYVPIWIYSLTRKPLFACVRPCARACARANARLCVCACVPRCTSYRVCMSGSNWAWGWHFVHSSHAFFCVKWICVCVRVPACLRVYVCEWGSLLEHTYTHTHIHKYTHTYI